MSKPALLSRRTTSRGAGRSHRAIRLASLTALALAFAASTALAAHLALTLGSTSNAMLGEHVIVSSQGRTLYTLSPETSKHLLCKGECLGFWPPLTVGSAKTKLKNGPGVQGRLGLLRRSNGTFQVTLRGMPLYRYSKDRAKGETNGQGIESFGGTWHAATASSSETAKAPSMSATQPAPTSTPSAPAPAPPYQYPAY
jgi:predicted lipoprotein with Yx(FWY)xxD motif